jgi:hypothetical protein
MRFRLLLLILGCVCILSTQSMGAVFTMTANDSNSATTSLNSDTQLHWSPAGAPAAGNDYYSVGFLLRTPTTAGNYTFAGDSLTIGIGSALGQGTGAAGWATDGTVNNNCLINKTPGTAVITVSNLILNKGTVRDGMGSGDGPWTLAGGLNITAGGGGFACQEAFTLASTITGSGPTYVCDNGSGEAVRCVTITSGLNTYDGSVQLLGTTAARSRITFAAGSLMNFTIGASGVNNHISGTGTATYNGNFNLNLTGASTNLGDAWTLSSAAAPSYGATFSVNGFVNEGNGFWAQAIPSSTNYYVYNQNNGVLMVQETVPEPATIVMILTGVLGVGLLWLRRK